MSLLLKDPAAVLDYAVDWAADYLDTDEVATSDWTVTPVEEGGVEVVSATHSPGMTTVKAGGGIAGRIYRLTNHVVLASGREDRRSIILRVEKR